MPSVDPYRQPFSHGDLRLLRMALPILLCLATVTTIVATLRGRPAVEIDEAVPQIATFRLDVNEATWPELALVPGIGETLARRIVTHRERQGKFRTLSELTAVAGIGEKLASRIAAYALPLRGDLPPRASDTSNRE